MPAPITMPESRSRTLLLGSFAVLYLVWGSSFVANKIMATELPTLLSAGVRFTLGGLLLGAFAAWRGARLPASALEWRHVAVMALLTVVVSNGINMLGLRYVPSNQVALLNASTAFWIAVFGTFGSRGHALSRRAQVGLGIGFAGVVLVLLPRGNLSMTSLGWQLAILAACGSWAASTLYHRLVNPTTPPVMFAATQMTAGGVVLVALGAGDAGDWQWTTRGALALAYATLFSSCLAYAAFAYLMVRTTPARLGTYAYVNPAVAAVTGWALLGETLGAVQLLGSAVIIAGVALVTMASTTVAAPE